METTEIKDGGELQELQDDMTKCKSCLQLLHLGTWPPCKPIDVTVCVCVWQAV
jgi:hypothetical protein